MEASKYVIGVDVGTGSVRAGLFMLDGTMVSSAVEPIEIWKLQPDFVEQSSADIWRAVCSAIRKVVSDTQISPADVIGIGFDATCSLVVLDRNLQPLAVNAEGVNERNIIVWMDHRALAEAEDINSGNYKVLRYVGGRISPEMEPPKLKWLKSNLPETWAKAGRFFDLADYLTFRSSGLDARSFCTSVCKWAYLGHKGKHGQWDTNFFRKIGLDDLFDDEKVSHDVRPIGNKLGNLTQAAADELGLTTECAVGVGIIDAHAGGIGLLGAVWEGKKRPSLQLLESALALIGGTSNCHMAVSREPRFIDGVWGPYYGAMIPDMWLTEGGQSTAGSAIDHIIADHAYSAALQKEAHRTKQTVYQLLNTEVERLQSELGVGPELTRDLHILPYFLGNRSPKADPYARATIDGLTLDESLASLAIRYLAVIQAIAYGTREIIRVLNDSGYSIKRLYVTGGGTKNPLWLQEHADITGCTIHLPKESEAVLLGAAILGATAAGEYDSVPDAMHAMCSSDNTIKPRKECNRYHKAKFKIFQELYLQQKRRRELMHSI